MLIPVVNTVHVWANNSLENKGACSLTDFNHVNNSN